MEAAGELLAGHDPRAQLTAGGTDLELAKPARPLRRTGDVGDAILFYAPEIVPALFEATEVWFHEIPRTPRKVLAGL